MSVRELLATLTGIQETMLLCPTNTQDRTSPEGPARVRTPEKGSSGLDTERSGLFSLYTVC